MDREKLNHYKQLLLDMKEEAKKELGENDKSYNLSKEYPDDSIGEVTNYDNHPADLGTEMFEREKAATLNSQARQRISEIEHALDKIEKGKYGYSEASGKPIPEERLEIEPTARYLVEEVDNE
ncbi:hypothetical protein [Sediminibacillus albus]|uniref:RNA polymerase-binding transcription factor DksA n=1 Tax=Sediminibacillus albus TaxID=407036 RepID=A0A1G8Z1M1_9BACI|nr:hypothetical protein [Sediminibacillus albus]SDK08534.1 RNA polymerase-binding transcription factor DksA [Sediminibacillus albus]